MWVYPVQEQLTHFDFFPFFVTRINSLSDQVVEYYLAVVESQQENCYVSDIHHLIIYVQKVPFCNCTNETKCVLDFSERELSGGNLTQV